MAQYERYIIVHTTEYGISRDNSEGPDIWHIIFPKDQMDVERAIAFGEELARFRSFSSCNSMTITREEYRYKIRYSFQNATKLQAMAIRVRRAWEKFMNETISND